MMGVIASEPHGDWVSEQLRHYQGRHFIKEEGFFDLTTNVTYITERMKEQGFLQNGKEQDYKDLHVFPVDYFCPRQTTGEYIRTENTYCEHLGLASWSEKSGGWKRFVQRMLGVQQMTCLIKLKRKIFG